MRALYAYGTLIIPEVLEAVIGRRPHWQIGVLQDYACHRVQQQVYPAIVERAGARVSGVVYFALSPEEFTQLDHYEGDLYERRSVRVSLGGGELEGVEFEADTFVLVDGHHHHLGAEGWDAEEFRRKHLQSYLARMAVTGTAPQRD